MRYIILICILSLTLIILSGCGGDKITGQVTADLVKNSIKNGERTTLEVNGENTGNVEATVVLKIIPEDSSKVIIDYPNDLTFTLQPDEDTGTKLIGVTGYTDYSSTTYEIKTQLINVANNEVLDQKIKTITVNK